MKFKCVESWPNGFLPIFLLSLLVESDDQEDEGIMSEYTDCMNLINIIDRLLELKASTVSNKFKPF